MGKFLLVMVAALLAAFYFPGCAHPPDSQKVEDELKLTPSSTRLALMPYLNRAKALIKEQEPKLFKNYDEAAKALALVSDAMHGGGMPTELPQHQLKPGQVEPEEWAADNVGEICRHGYVILVSNKGGMMQIMQNNGRYLECQK